MKDWLAVLFGRRRKFAGAYAPRVAETGTPQDPAHSFRIDFDMMLKGSVYKRRGGMVRQYGVTVNGSTRLVTSGETVDLDTYNALLAAGAIRPLSSGSASAQGNAPGLLDLTSSEGFDNSR